MELALSRADLAFLVEARHFIDRHWPESARGFGPVALDQPDERPTARAWFDALAKRGWSVPLWPVEQGGTGWSPVRRYLWDRETAAAETPRMDDFAVTRLGPLLCRRGSRAQQRRLLPPIREALVRWCQVRADFSAPVTPAGRTPSAVRSGNHYMVHGENIAAPGAQMADWIFCPARVRQDRGASAAIVLLLMDLRSPGICVDHGSVTFTDVPVPVAQRVGAERRGSTCDGTLLGHESGDPGPVAACRAQLRRIAEIARQIPAAGATVADDAAFQRKYGELEVDLLGLEALELRVVAGLQAQATGAARSEEPHVLKAVLDARHAPVQRRMQDLMVETLGYDALPFPDLLLGDNQGPIGHPEALRAVQGWLSYLRADGRSSEFQKDIIARSALNL